jgi:tRNA threonylcarbamoyladenosine biosynthesis protein TsaB
MAWILCLETATRVCSAGLFSDDTLISLRESDQPNIHSASLTVFVEEVMKEAGISFSSLAAVAVSMGPGSYTGLRIGVASAKGFCHALDKPLIAVSTLHTMALGMAATPTLSDIHQDLSKVLFCPMIDARRMEVYCGVYDFFGNEIREVRADIIDPASFSDLLHDRMILFGGDGAEKCRELLGRYPNARFMTDFQASSRFMVKPAFEKFHQQSFENLAYFEPFYLKDFVAGKPHVKGLR